MKTTEKFRKAIKKLFFGGKGSKQEVIELYEKNDYLKAYSQHTDIRINEDSQNAIGGMWEEIGLLQFEFLKRKGMRPGHTMLDIGCGTLRGGRHFIGYLDVAKYHGMDISKNALSTARENVEKHGLSVKKPKLVLSENMNLKFLEFAGQQFDYILAQSVFSHLMPEHIEECFEHIGSIMHSKSVFYFTYNKGEKYAQLKLKDFCYPYSFFESLAEQHGFVLRDCTGDYNHPRNQNMLELIKQQDIG